MATRGIDNAPSVAWNPRYVLWAKKHGLTPKQMLEKDKRDWPGGCMLGFSQWIQERRDALLRFHQLPVGDLRQLCNLGLDMHKTFDNWLEASILES